MAGGTAVELGKLLLRTRETDLESFGFAQPAFAPGLSDAGNEVVAEELITWDINVDSTSVRAHQHAAWARKGVPSEGAAWRHRRRAARQRPRTLARGGLSATLHPGVDQGQRPCPS
ncbi:hypothetical protein [Streptomyces sp. NPDC001816]|uniref:hypothetical protein n=1 Tax=Streptomyces sp. NPDC001816 TaxID=3364612 RepID=UPI0036B01BAA